MIRYSGNFSDLDMEPGIVVVFKKAASPNLSGSGKPLQQERRLKVK